MYIEERLAFLVCVGVLVIGLMCIGLAVVCGLLKDENERLRGRQERKLTEREERNREDVRRFVLSTVREKPNGKHERSGGNV